MDTPPSRRDKWLARLWGLVKKTLLLLPFAGPLLEPGSLRYLRALPVRRLVRLLLALFFTFSAIGFYLDLVQWRLASRTTVVLAGLLIGGVAVSSFLIIRRSARLLPLLFVLGVILGLTIDRLPRGALPAPGDEAHRAIVRDATAMLLAIMVGYRSFLGFIGHEGVEHLRLNTELALAHDIQRTLVPSVIHRGLRFQAYGRTVPSDKVGGDLVDLTAAGTNKWLAYVADVSGHGIPAGVLMGNIKTAIRLGADSQQPLPDLLNALNRVLPSVKDASMYTTFAGVKLQDSGNVEHLIAAHPPILCYRRLSRDVERWTTEQFPVGLFPQATYQSATASVQPGDVIVLLSDGVLETADRNGMELGLERVEQLICAGAGGRAEAIAESILAAAAKHGAQTDDQTVLVISILA